MIDKIHLYLNNTIKFSSLSKKLKMSGIQFGPSKLRSGTWYKISEGRSEVLIRLDMRSGIIFKVMINPAKCFATFAQMKAYLTRTLGPQVLAAAKVMEVHFAVDYNLKFEEVFRGIYIVHKRKMEIHSEGGQRTGAYFGAGDERVVVYDKFRERMRRKKSQGIVDPTTRVEWRVKSKKIGANSFDKLERLLGDIAKSGMPLFEKIYLYEIAVRSPDQVHGFVSERCIELRTAIKFAGYFEARKLLNKNGNFSRTYERYLTKIPIKPHPAEKLTESLRFFVDPSE